VLNPQDERAIEMACQMGEAVAVVVGVEEDVDVLRNALARGAAKGILVTHPDARSFDAVVIARILSTVAKDFEKVVCGTGWPSDALGQVGYRLGAEIVAPSGPSKLPSAMAIMKAMKKEIRKVKADELGVDLTPVTVVKGLSLP
jgi:electron transfer flavoprotein beta subunit